MIFYFSGTGNSAFIAKKLAMLLGDEVKNIADFYDDLIISISRHKYKGVDIDLKGNYLGIVCPVHSWGLAKSMARFLKYVRFNGFCNQNVFVVVTCGDNCGTADYQVKKLLKKYNNIDCQQIFSVQMPNTYIVMKGFGVDSDDVAHKKLVDAEPEIERITEAIKNRTDYKHYVRGTKPFLKGRIIYPLFMAFTMGDKKFFAKSNCTACGLCAKQCPEHNIELQNKRPKWLGHCVKCLSCIHRCPVTAIQYGDITENMGRYYFRGL